MLEWILLFSVLANVAVVALIALVLLVMPKTAKTLIWKKFGLLGKKTLNFVFNDDNVVELLAQNVTSDGVFETIDEKSGKSKMFFLAKPLDCGSDPELELAAAERAKIVMPLYNIDGYPVGVSYAGVGVVTNPKVIIALNNAAKVSVDAPNVLTAGVKLPGLLSEKLPEQLSSGLPKVFRVKVYLPFDVRDVANNFAHYWSMPDLDAVKIRWKNIGALSNSKDYSSMGKLILVGVLLRVLRLRLLVCLGGGAFA
jgi:hypothetical protein